MIPSQTTGGETLLRVSDLSVGSEGENSAGAFGPREPARAESLSEASFSGYKVRRRAGAASVKE